MAWTLRSALLSASMGIALLTVAVAVVVVGCVCTRGEMMGSHRWRLRSGTKTWRRRLRHGVYSVTVAGS